MLRVCFPRELHHDNWHATWTEVPPDVVWSLLPKDDAVHHPRPPQPFPFHTPTVIGRIGVMVDEFSSLGAHESFTSCSVETRTHNVRVPYLQGIQKMSLNTAKVQNSKILILGGLMWSIGVSEGK